MLPKNNHIVFITDSPGWGGSEKSLTRVVNFLKSDFECEFVISKEADKRLLDFINNAGFKFHRFSIPSSAKFALHGIAGALKLINKFKGNVTFMVWCHHPDSNRWVQLILALTGRKFILAERSVPKSKMEISGSKLVIPIKRLVIGKAGSVVVCGHSQTKVYQSVFGEANFDVIVNSREVKKIGEIVKNVRSNWVPPFQIHGKLITSIGRLSAEKDPVTLLKAFSIVAKQMDCTLVFIGEGEVMGELQAQVSEEQISHVFFSGYTESVYEWLSVSSVFVSASLIEGLPGALIEAMSAKVPCVVTNIPGNNELIIHHETGLLVPVKNPSEMAKAIHYILNNSQVASGFADKALELVTKDYSSEEEYAGWHNLLNRIA